VAQGSSSSPAGYYVNGVYYGTTPPSTGWPYTSTSSSYGYTCYPLTTSSSTSPYYHPSPYPSSYAYSPTYHTAPQTSAYPYGYSYPYIAPTSASIFAYPPGPAQAAAAVAANAALAAMPSAPAYFVGATASEIAAQNAILLANMQAAKAPPSQLVPYKPGASPQFWCKELDGSWTLREYNDSLKHDFPKGHWEKHASSGYYYFVRHAS
jgi:hypothetical protein